MTTLLETSTPHDYIFFRRIGVNTDVIVFGYDNLESNINGSLSAQTPTLTPPGVGEFQYYARVRESDNHSVFYDSPVLTLTVTGNVTVAAEPASKLLPTFRATVTPVAPATRIPTGTVQFEVNGQAVCTDQLDGSGEAGCHALLVIVANSYTARYSGDAFYLPASDTAPLVLLPSG